MAKVRPAGRMRPSNLFLRPRPLELFIIWKFKDKIFKICTYFMSKMTKQWIDGEKVCRRFTFNNTFLKNEARSQKYFSNMALEQKSLATPAIYPAQIIFWVLFSCYKEQQLDKYCQPSTVHWKERKDQLKKDNARAGPNLLKLLAAFIYATLDYLNKVQTYKNFKVLV